jgi:hypothetical protein
MSQEQYLKARNKKSPDGTVASENKLSPGNTAAEAFFETKTSHAPKDLKNIYPGQDIASLVYATPKGGTHTIDRYPGSVTVSEYIYTGAVLDSQKNLLITRHTAAIAKNLKALNDQFKLTITPEQYTNILKTGVVPNELTQKGLALDKNPQFIEARAMIKDKNGNVCANRTEAIIFPTFSFTETIIIPGQPAKYKTITQNVPSPSTYDPDVGGA